MVDIGITTSQPGLTAEQAREILRKRKAASESLVGFARYVDVPGVPIADSDFLYEVVETELADHHILTYEVLDDMLEHRLWYDPETLARVDAWTKGRKECRRVMIMEPPGSAKSTCASVVTPSYVMGKWPGTEVILTGYGDVIAKRHGKRARQLCRSDSYRAVWDSTLDPGMKAADDWALNNGSTYKSAGILSGITGFRCDGLIWDDLVKGRKEADSDTIREDTWNAYIDDARSRKKPSAWEIGIGTRWHEDDPMGRLLPKGYAGENGFIQCRDGNVWYVICLPAKAERADDPLGREIGEFIWPEWFGEDYWHDKMLNPRSWASLYQQRPAPDEGLYFRKEWFKRYDSEPEGDYYIAFDAAVTDAEDNPDADFTVLQVWKVDAHGRLYLIDEWRRQATMDVWIAEIINLVRRYKPLEVIGESGQIRRAAEPFLKRAMRNTRVFARFTWVNRDRNKAAMARAAQAMYSAGQMYHPNNSVGDNMENELLRVWATADDHRADTVANLCLRLEAIFEAGDLPAPKEKTATIIDKPLFRPPPRFPKKRTRWA